VKKDPAIRQWREYRLNHDALTPYCRWTIEPKQQLLETEYVTDTKENPFEEPIEVEIETNGQAGNPEEADPERDESSEKLAEAEQELSRHREAMLRMQAEMENLRKRLMRDLDRSRKLALEKIMKDLLQVWDSLERGLEVDSESLTVESLLEGQELTLRMLEKVMQDHDLQIIDPMGQPFDPELHQAMTVLPSADVPENTVLEVLQKGFSLHDRLVRPAMVVVSGKA
jgi:molecular chaperone GrpE